MAIRLSCQDYGFECNFQAEGDNLALIIEKFGKHTSQEHGIEYSKESLMQFILRKTGG
jgi:predicted small metal-binding protein